MASKDHNIVELCKADIALGRAHMGRSDWTAAEAALISAQKPLIARVQLDGTMVCPFIYHMTWLACTIAMS